LRDARAAAAPVAAAARLRLTCLSHVVGAPAAAAHAPAVAAGAFSNIQVARDAVCSLILGSPPGKVYNHMRQVAARVQQRY
jgi:hypothetical protein